MFRFIFTRKISTIGERSLVQLKQANDKFNSKIKGTFLEKWVNYWKLVARDYKDVIVSVRQDFKDRPVKSCTIVTGIGLLTYCAKHNPDVQSFRAKYVQSANELGLVAPTVVNPDSLNHLKYVEQCFNANLIRYLNLGIFSIVWVDKYSKQCDKYESNCSYLQIQYRRFSDQILDVGFLNTWWITSRKMLDYDINY